MEAKIAYFSAEFGIDTALPIYSGGLGVLAGDHVKAANDMGVPLIAVGIFYRKGYFKQRIGADGSQEVSYPILRPEELPITLVLDEQGQSLLVTVPIADRNISLRAWKAQVGSIPVYLLDADHEGNQPGDRSLTHHLYGGNQETRIGQEIILGIGGVRLLRVLHLEPDVWHMNEGHSAFLALERIREYSAQGVPFDTAWEAVKASTVFTTHTPVPAGHDQFSFELMDRYLGDYYWQLGASRERILALGTVGQQFNMTRLAVHTSSKVNGVSKLHAEVSKELLHQWTPEIPKQHVPVEAITNGVHTKTWLAPEMKQLFDRYLDAKWQSKISEIKVWDAALHIPDQEIWEAHQQIKKRMINYLGLPLSEETIIIGFARRFATYKRSLLLFQDMERLERLVQQIDRPVAFLFAGKAHPADLPGQELIRRIWEFSRQPAFQGRIFLLENYDMEMAKHLVSGVDVWLNTPIKPMEASGTSGQKAAVNGVLNCSVLDGWWNEGYNGKNGWAIPGEHDETDADTLYRLLEEEMIPLYYSDRSSWIQMMKESIRSLTPVFSTSCMLAEYWGKLYIPTAIRGWRFCENDLEVADRVATYKCFIRNHWDQVKMEEIDFIPTHRQVLTIHCKIRLGAIWHKDVSVEAVGCHKGNGLWRRELQWVKELDQGLYLYVGTFAGTRDDWLTAHAHIRVMPVSPDFANDYELGLVKWG